MSELVQLEAEQIAKYQGFLTKLKRDKLNTEVKIRQFKQKIEDYEQVQEYMANKIPPTKMNVGSNTYLDMELVNPHLLTLDVGMNIFIEMTFQEAKPIIIKQISYLEQKVIETQKSLNNIVTYMEQVEEILLQFK